MKSKYTPIITEESGWWIGRIEEVPSINCRAKTKTELNRSLALAVAEAAGLHHLASTVAERREHEELIRSLTLELVNAEGLDRENKLKASEAWRRGEGHLN